MRTRLTHLVLTLLTLASLLAASALPVAAQPPRDPKRGGPIAPIELKSRIIDATQGSGPSGLPQLNPRQSGY